MHNSSSVDRDLTQIRRNSRASIFTFTKNKQAVDLAGTTITFSLKKNKDDTDEDAIILKQLDIISATDGTALLELTPEETDLSLESYWYDVQFESTDIPRVTLMRGLFKVTWQNTEKSYA